MAVGQVPARPVHPRPSRSNMALKGQLCKFCAEMCWGCFHVDRQIKTPRTMLDRFPEIYEVEAVMPGFKVPTEAWHLAP